MKKVCSIIKSGFSLVELILASAIFALLITAFAGVYLYGEESTMLAGNRARAVMLATEGLEAVRNIRDPLFANLVDGNYGLATSSNQYSLTGTSDTDGFFTRSLNITSVDAKRKNINATVTWQQNAQRSGSLTLTSRLNNWQEASVSASINPLILYGNGTVMPKTRDYDNTTNTFSLEKNTATSSIGRTYVLRTSPKKAEAIAAFVSPTGVLNVMCYNGSSWTQEWSATVGGAGTTRRFDVAYETSSGNALILYSNNLANNNELAYRVKSGTSSCGSANWSAATNLSSARTLGIVHWVKMAWDRRSGSNQIAALWADSNADLSAMIWDGANWVNEPTNITEASLEIVSTVQDVEDFDLEYESLSGDLMLAWANSAGGNNVNGVRYRTCNGGTSTCTWSAVITPPTFNDDATNLDISANPNTDEIVFASTGNAASDLQLGYWSGSTWTNSANVDVSTQAPSAGTKLLSTGWLISGTTTRSVIVYDDSGAQNIGYYTGNLGVFTVQPDFTVSPAFANPQKYYQVEMSPTTKNQLMLCLSDNANDLSCKRLVMSATPTFTWTNPSASALNLTLTQNINSPFSFAYPRY